MEGYTLKPGDTLEAGKIAVLVDNDGVGREISDDELREVLAGKPIRVDTRRLGVCRSIGGLGMPTIAAMAAASEMARAFASQVSFDAEPPKPKTPKVPVIEMPREPLKSRRKQLLKILRDRQSN